MRYLISRIALHFEVLLTMVSVRRRLKSTGVGTTVRLAIARRQLIATHQHPPERIMRAVQRVGRWLVPGSNCLVQSVTLTSLLQRQSGNTVLIIGCGRVSNKWAAHAWVESRGNAYQPVFAASQTALARYDAVHNWRPKRATMAA